MGALTSARRRIGLPLRARAALAFGVGALVLSAALATLTYALCRSYLTSQRESTASEQTYLNARLLRNMLSAGDADLPQVLSVADRTADSSVVLHYRGDWFASSVAAGEQTVPASLRAVVAGGHAGKQRFDANGTTQLAVGVPVPSVGAEYFQVFTLAELRRTLSTLGTSLAIAAAITTLAGAAAGYWASGRVLRPLRRMASAAGNIAGGRLDLRLRQQGDRDLDPLTTSFNEMVDALEARIEREARFASDVSHELRSPLAALSAGIEVVHHGRAALPERTAVAVDVLHDQIGAFEHLVLDLLEISRFDAGVAELDLQEVDGIRFVEQVVHVLAPGVPVVHHHDGDDDHARLYLDRRRVRQVLGNLLDNARHHGGGATAVRVAWDDTVLRIAVEDGGPGVDEDERDTVFDRFRRGAVGHAHDRRGSGLGLSLVRAHVELHEGRAWVETAEGGGARFVVELPRTLQPAPSAGLPS